MIQVFTEYELSRFTPDITSTYPTISGTYMVVTKVGEYHKYDVCKWYGHYDTSWMDVTSYLPVCVVDE